MSDVPRLFRVLIEVDDLDRATAFYSELFGDPGRRIRGGRHYFDCGPVVVALLDVSGERAANPIAGDYYFSVSDLEAIHARARSLGCLSKETVHDESGGVIAVRPWGERSFYAKDPWGNDLCFVDETTLFTGR